MGLLRTALLDRELRSVAGALYACPITRVINYPQVANLGFPAIDPLRGLPGLPRSDLPPSPFRDLQPYGPSDAEVFFGRGAEIASYTPWLPQAMRLRSSSSMANPAWASRHSSRRDCSHEWRGRRM